MQVVIVMPNMTTKIAYDGLIHKAGGISGIGHRLDLEPFAGRTWIDLSQLAWPLALSGAVQARTLAALSEYYGVGDTNNLYRLDEIYWLMMNRYVMAQKAENAVRRMGGQALGKIISTFNR